MRAPDFIIGPHDAPYLRRWWIIPRNRFFNIYLHNFLKSDDDRALHDHMYVNASILLKGYYLEHTKRGQFTRKRWHIYFRRPSTAHRVEILPECPSVWTLFITGPRVRDWGFHCPNGWRHWKEFVDARDAGQIGRGCD